MSVLNKRAGDISDARQMNTWRVSRALCVAHYFECQRVFLFVGGPPMDQRSSKYSTKPT